jgi:hypothetical protein
MPISRSLKRYVLMLVLAAPWDAAISSASAQDLWPLSCGDLWYRRNAIFSRNGYCFKTGRAIRVFGNANCQFYVEADVPMSRSERQEVEIIRSIERRKGCEF